MRYSLRLQHAINIATIWHQGQARKADKLPYIIHPFAVMIIASEYTKDEDILIAALLHDTLEDTKYTLNDLTADFGPKIAKIVKEVSEVKTDENDQRLSWDNRKTEYLNTLRTACSGALLIAAADKIHNLDSLVAAYRAQGESMWKKFNSPADKKIWVYEQTYQIIKQRLKNPIVQKLAKTLKSAKKSLTLDKIQK